jgi:hypothetical protein
LLAGYYFDFGGANLPAAYGYQRATSSHYQLGEGYGWDALSVIGWKDRGAGGALNHDFVFGRNGTFLVNLPNGNYALAPTVGDVTISHTVSLQAQGRPLGAITTAPGQFLHPVYHILVTNGQLQLRLIGGNIASPYFALAALDLMAVPPGGLLSVRTFGATGNGVADDAAAIQKAIDALPTGGGVVYLPAGQYMLGTAAGFVDLFPNGASQMDALIIGTNHVTCVGEGSATVLKLMPHAKMRILTITSWDVTVRDLIADGNKANRDGSVSFPGGDVVSSLLNSRETSADITIRECEVRNGLEDGIGLWDSPNAVIVDCYSHDNGTAQAGAAGIALGGSQSQAGFIWNCRLSGNSAAGIWLSFGSSHITIKGNHIEDNLKAGIAICGNGSLPTPLSWGILITYNTLRRNGGSSRAAINIVSSQHGVLAHNVIVDNYVGGVDFVSQASIPTSDWVVADNVFGNTSCSATQQYAVKRIGICFRIAFRNNTWVAPTATPTSTAAHQPTAQPQSTLLPRPYQYLLATATRAPRIGSQIVGHNVVVTLAELAPSAGVGLSCCLDNAYNEDGLRQGPLGRDAVRGARTLPAAALGPGGSQGAWPTETK